MHASYQQQHGGNGGNDVARGGCAMGNNGDDDDDILSAGIVNAPIELQGLLIRNEQWQELQSLEN